MPRALNLSLGARDTRRRPVPAPTAVRIARRRSGRSARHAPVALLKQPAGAWRTFSRMRTVKDGEDEEKTVTCILRFSGTKMASAIQYAVWSSATEKNTYKSTMFSNPRFPTVQASSALRFALMSAISKSRWLRTTLLVRLLCRLPDLASNA